MTLTFLCGRGGLYALGAVAANYKGDPQGRDFFLKLFLEVLSIFITVNTFAKSLIFLVKRMEA